jgi:Tfp pilus assembly protein FimT
MSNSQAKGISLLELVVSLAVILIISGLAIPAITRTLRTYQLNDAANQVAGILKFTRFEAIRRNTPIRCRNSQAATQTSLWSDNDDDGTPGATEKQVMLGPNATLVPAGAVPNTSALGAATGLPSLTAMTPSNDAIRFDQRGAVIAVPSAVYVFYLGNGDPASGGYRAVIVLPSGSVQVWTYVAGTGSIWQRVS